VLLAIPPGSTAKADQLYTAPEFGSRGYTAIEELSYETIFTPRRDYAAELSVRLALHNTSAERQDFVQHLALPVTAELERLRVARNGKWTEHAASDVHAAPVERRVDGAFFARVTPPTITGGPPSAELVGIGIEGGATVQVELVLSVQPRLRGDRWQVDLPRRGDQNVLASDRRTIVKGLDVDEDFWVDGISSDGSPYMITRRDDVVTVAWPADVRSNALLSGRYDVTPDRFGSGGTFRVMLRLGDTRALSPDHVSLVVDRSKSTASRLAGDTRQLVDHMFDQLPASTTFDAVAFARDAEPLLTDDDNRPRLPRVDDPGARGEVAMALDTAVQAQGTDLREALMLAASRLERSDAKRPLLLVVTDGMLPQTLDAEAIRRDLAKAAGRKRPPDILFVVDDPILAQRGLAPDHPAARTAGALGARISLQALANVHAAAGLEILTAPSVLGNLEVGLPSGVQFDEEVPSGLVAGNVVILEGRYEKRAPSSLTVRGKMGRRRVGTRLRAVKPPPRPEALAATTDPERTAEAAAEGFAHPDWYTRHMTETAKAKIARAGASTQRPQGQLDGDIFHWYLRRRVLPRAKACFDKAVARNQLQGGRVILEMEVGKGEVMFAHVANAQLTSPDDKLLECLDDAAWALEIPAAKLDERIYTLRYPIKLEPPRGGRARGEGDGQDAFVDMLVEQADILAR